MHRQLQYRYYQALRLNRSLQRAGVSPLEISLCALFWMLTPGATVILSCYFSWRLAKLSPRPQQATQSI